MEPKTKWDDEDQFLIYNEDETQEQQEYIDEDELYIRETEIVEESEEDEEYPDFASEDLR